MPELQIAFADEPKPALTDALRLQFVAEVFASWRRSHHLYASGALLEYERGVRERMGR